MQTLFSHIVQKRLSRENEDIATESFAFLLSEKRELRLGFTEFLRNFVPELPELHFRSQLMQGGDRPDLTIQTALTNPTPNHYAFRRTRNLSKNSHHITATTINNHTHFVQRSCYCLFVFVTTFYVLSVINP